MNLRYATGKQKILKLQPVKNYLVYQKKSGFFNLSLLIPPNNSSETFTMIGENEECATV